VTDPDQEWEIRNIVGQKTIGGKVYYWVDWEPTWMAEFELDNARELIDGFVAKLQYSPRESWYGHGREVCSKRGQQEIGATSGNAEPKKRRGRPRKETKA
jgi:hypothetical protein